ncbi:MAG: phenylalanine--tRNA ligase subunit beta [Desulfobulbaceae bacterium]|nr:phenylalanine--tRNA ligase subunit beta [Desulfobulbaceae bacterium]
MKFTINWLKNYLDFELSVQELADRLTMLGLEVDSVASLYPDLTGVRVARIMAVQPHPNADRLQLCDVDDGEGMRRVVCGALNARAGLVTALATPGTVMPGGMVIAAAKIRGEASAGMLCSTTELGIGGAKSGIMELAAELTPGAPLAEALGLHDTLVEVDLTPNRPDCASVIGLAREVGGVTGARVKHPSVEALPEVAVAGLPFSVEVLDREACPRYSARLIRGVKIAPSPWWLQRLLLAVGLRPINNVVDITNFVMLEYGQPLHAFDFAKLAGGKIIVRRANAGEILQTLDGTERKLDPEMLLICDGERAVAVAGVMGGGNSEVSDATTDILLESAYFNPVSVRRTSKRLNMATDSSYRFERGVDPEGTVRALHRAVGLIVELTGGEVVPGGVDSCAGLPVRPLIQLRAQRCADLLGIAINAEEIATRLAAIEIPSRRIDAEALEVMVPGFRVDLEREIDLIEEVARVVGYNELPTTLPMVPLSFADSDPARLLRAQVARVMSAQGFSEAINYSFVTEKHFDLLGLAADDSLRATVKLRNPLSDEQSVMRTMLLPGLLENVRRNINHQVPDLRLFETGKVFHPGAGELPREEVWLVAAMAGRRYPAAPVFYFGQVAVDFYDIKAVVEQLLAEMRYDGVKLVAENCPPRYVDSADALVVVTGDGGALGRLGRLQADCLRAFGIKTEVFYLELNLTALGLLTVKPKSFRPLARFPSVSWDLAVVVPEEVASGEIIAAITDCGEILIERVELFDVYQGESIGAGLKSVAISITYRDQEKTLADDVVQVVQQRIINMIGVRFGGCLREN